MKHVTAAGQAVPAVGLGTWQLTGADCYEAVQSAVDLGYRHIDTAQVYGNEREIGDAIGASGVDRDSLFLTTKLGRGSYSYDAVLRSTDESLSKLDTEYLDLLLIHWPVDRLPTAPSLSETIDAMNELHQRGKVRHIGVSNFGIDRLHRARTLSEIPILTNQVQYHPFWDQTQLLDYCQIHDVILTAYSPFGHGSVIGDQTLCEIGERYGKSSAQVALRWLLQQEMVCAIPKASSPDHLKANIDVFDFELTDSEMETIHRPSKLRTVSSMVASRLSDWNQ
ncbi:aldo/keto reductase [Halocatena pleomorpha]|uniref:Aldo/keto reductase n=1 Tax=Halocatena pleomorpha TaxID=1785090 RepID=A0A3P3RLG1_9EURY|nr:aldo/keto reductase [Halocatena pleomorpha]RRJ33738.1 aldo/keto reductase [Halocatena pleomorpha]